MNPKASILTTAALFAALSCIPASAAQDDVDAVSLHELSGITGIAPPSLRLLFGARSSHANYGAKLRRVDREWQDAIARLAAEGIAVSVQNDGRISLRRGAALVARAR